MGDNFLTTLVFDELPMILDKEKRGLLKIILPENCLTINIYLEKTETKSVIKISYEEVNNRLIHI